MNAELLNKDNNPAHLHVNYAGAVGRQRIRSACLNPSKISGSWWVGFGQEHDLCDDKRKKEYV
uniref:Uncharacterized protein n=1 Tax=Setaria italica TaxID=4555 RepID=K3ZYV8_SETIT